MAGDSILGSQFADYANMIRDALLRYSGSLATYEENVGRQLRNPLAWLQRGSQLVVVSPLLLLRGIGFTIIPSTGRLLGATLVKALSAIAALVGLIASVVTIAAGWDDARALVTSLGDLLG